MMERCASPQESAFSQTFTVISHLVQDPTKQIRIRYANLFEIDTHGAGNVNPVFEVIEEDYVLGQTTSLQGEEPIRYPICRYWFSSAPEEVKRVPMVDLVRYRSAERTGGINPWTVLPGHSLESKFWLGKTFVHHAPNAGELGKVLAKVFWLDSAIPGDHGSGEVTAVTQNALVKSIEFIRDQETAQAFIQPVVRAFKTESPQFQEKIRTRLSNGLIKLLRGAYTGRYTEKEVEGIPKEAIVRAVELYDTAGLIRDSFWNSSALISGFAAELPAFLPLLHAKLSGPDGQRLVAGILEPTPIAADYIKAVLQHYAEDPTRNTDTVNRILQRIRRRSPKNQDQQAQDQGIDLEALLREANILGASYNRMIDQRRGEESEKYAPLHPTLATEAAFIGDAFLRLASVMRRRDAPQKTRSAQLDQDVMHADILSIVLSGVPAGTRISYADLKVRFPEIEPKRLRIIQRLLKTGLPLGRAMERPDIE